jgi:ATPase subunit of ABC transporter with duplicated ATPase domains
MTDEQRRLTFLRDNVEHLEEEKGALENLAYTLQNGTEEQVTEILNRLRSHEDIHQVAQSLSGGRFSAERGEGSVSGPSGGCELKPQSRTLSW